MQISVSIFAEKPIKYGFGITLNVVSFPPCTLEQ